ncbi:NAD(P)-binding protein [Macrolepiota fuliginosa MF-IS2]|uniref:NAD(P)-binding protein n=1 Tax=Macrolepiota fuliginosa MF-IS2 TaxID=1400762 RepID=A0A9P5XSJ4_9AGAR|nr:NAD(P)-binding protein [Macrolepiota fuliginosa MF-IS2]
MRFLVLGGTGPCGIHLIRQLLSHYPSSTIVIYARSPHKLPAELSDASNPALVIIKGDLTDKDAVERALEGVDVVLSALGPALGQPKDTPLAKGYELVIDSMHKYGVKRLIALGTTSIVDPADKFSLAYFSMINGVKIGARSAYDDIVAIGDAIRTKGRDLDWTIVRVPILTNSDSTAVVAGYVGDEIENRQWVKKAPLITST